MQGNGGVPFVEVLWLFARMGRRDSKGAQLVQVVVCTNRETRVKEGLPLVEISRLAAPRVLHHELVHYVILVDALGSEADADHRAVREVPPCERPLSMLVQFAKFVFYPQTVERVLLSHLEKADTLKRVSIS